MIDYYIKPLLNSLNIVPLTFREYLRPQDLMDEKNKELVKSANGIIGFYTYDDKIENIEYELSLNENIIAICIEKGARSPSLRRARLQIGFSREKMADILLRLLQTLKERNLFNLVI